MNLSTMCLIMLLLMGSGSSAQAQFRDSLGGRWNNPVSASIGTSLAWRALIQAPKAVSGAKASPQVESQGSVAPTVTFPSGKPSTVATALAESMGEGAAHKQELASAFRQFLEAFEEDAIKDKEPRNLARAAAFFIVVNHMTATGKPPVEAHAEGLQRALQQNLLHHGPFQAMGARQRQDLYETLVILAYLPMVGVRDAEERRQPERVTLFRTLARQGLKTLLGATPESMTFSETGLAFK